MRRYTQHQHPRLQNSGLSEPPESINVPGSLLPLVTSGIWHSLRLFQAGLLPQGFVWRMDLKSHEIDGQKVVSVHRCEFCGLSHKDSDVPALRMRDALSYLTFK